MTSLSENLPRWRLSCFSGADSKASDLGQQARSSNEVNGDVSFEEVRWADYQTPDKSKCAARFAQATTLKNQQFEVGHKACSDQWHCKPVSRLTSHFDCRADVQQHDVCCCFAFPWLVFHQFSCGRFACCYWQVVFTCHHQCCFRITHTQNKCLDCLYVESPQKHCFTTVTQLKFVTCRP